MTVPAARTAPGDPSSNDTHGHAFWKLWPLPGHRAAHCKTAVLAIFAVCVAAMYAAGVPCSRLAADTAAASAVLARHRSRMSEKPRSG